VGSLANPDVVFPGAAHAPHIETAIEEPPCGVVAAVSKGGDSICEGKQGVGEMVLLAVALHSPVCNAETTIGRDNRVKEVRELPVAVVSRGGRVGDAELAGCLRAITIHARQRKDVTMLNAIRQFVKEEEGASAAEYALLVGLITVLMATAVTGLGTAIQGAINNATTAIS
jgi:pilus assembly protein Flp/PilA